MLARAGTLICALAALAAAGCATQTGTTVPAGAEVYPAGGSQTYVTTAPVTGTVVRVDEAARVLVLDDGRMWQAAGDAMVLVDGRPVALRDVRPGQRVAIRSAHPVAYRDGRYVVMDPAAAPAAGAGQPLSLAPHGGTVIRVDEPARVLVFDDGRMWQVAGDSAVLVDGTPVVIGRIAPGTRVLVQSGQPVRYRDGRYEPMAVAAATEMRQTVWGTVTDVDRDGGITVRAPDGEKLEMRVPRSVADGVRRGDTVRLDVEFLPGGAASPRMR